jgi:N-acetylneuraminic acid mutarotase
MNRKIYVFMISTLILFLATLFLFFWWVFAIGFFPLEKESNEFDYKSRLEAGPPISVTEAGGASLNHMFYLLGGLGSLGQTFSSFYGYNNETLTWKMLKEFPCPISHPGIVSGNGKIYVAGGFDPLGIRLRGFMFADWKPRHSFMIYNPISDEWENGEEMPFSRGSGGVCYYDSVIYYAGGIDQNKQICNSFFRFDLRTNKWDSLTPMPTPRDHLRMEAVNGMLYAIAGRKDDLRFNLNCVEAYDIKNNFWVKKADIPIGRGGLGTAVINGKIYTFGGENIWNCFDNFEEYDPELDKWRILSSLPEPRHGICAGVIGNEIHMVSGGLKPRISVSNLHRVITVKPFHLISIN